MSRREGRKWEKNQRDERGTFSPQFTSSFAMSDDIFSFFSFPRGKRQVQDRCLFSSVCSCWLYSGLQSMNVLFSSLSVWRNSTILKQSKSKKFNEGWRSICPLRRSANLISAFYSKIYFMKLTCRLIYAKKLFPISKSEVSHQASKQRKMLQGRAKLFMIASNHLGRQV